MSSLKKDKQPVETCGKIKSVNAQAHFQPHFHGLRGMAAMVVLFSHYIGAFFQTAHSGNSASAHAGWEIIFAKTPRSLPINGCFAVCLFFILSGYVLTLPYFGPHQRDTFRLWAAIFKRPIRLSGIVFFTIGLSYILNRGGLYFNGYAAVLTKSGWFSNLGNPPLDVRQLIHDIIWTPFSSAGIYSGPLWTIPLELYGGIGSFLFVMLCAQSKYRWLGKHWRAIVVQY